MDPAVGDKVVVSGTLTSRPAEDTAVIALTVECAARAPGRGYVQVRLPAEHVDAAAGSPGRPHPAPPSVTSKRLMDSAARSPALTAAVAWPCDRDSLLGPLQAMRDRRAEADPGRPARGDREGCCRPPASRWTAPNFEAETPSRPRSRRGQAVPRRPRRGADEGQPAHRRADGRRRVARGRAAHRAPHQPCLRDGRAVLSTRRCSSRTPRSTSSPTS